MVLSQLKAASAKEPRPFPKLMIYKGEGHHTVVFFQEYGKVGTQVFSTSEANQSVNLVESKGWIIDEFRDFDGEVILKNQD